MNTRIIPSTLSLAILGLVSQESMTGYDLRKVFTTTPMGHFSTSPGAIYPALRRMAQAGLIRGSVEGRDTLRPKQTYTITKKGLEVLKEKLLAPITRDDVVRGMEELTLRFAFMGVVLGKREALQYLNQLVLCINEYIPILLEHLEAQRKIEGSTGAYALEHGIARYDATVMWARRVIRNLEGDSR
jgi:DNA-binding PadR family transcriptional regulator